MLIELNGFKAEQPVTVVPKTLVGIEIIKPADKTEYIDGDTFNPTGMVVIGTFDNGEKEEITDYDFSKEPLVEWQPSIDIIVGDLVTPHPITVDPNYVVGDVDMNGVWTANDAALVLQKVLDGSYILPCQVVYPNHFMYIADASANGVLTAEDSSLILQKVLDGSFTVPMEEAIKSDSYVYPEEYR